MKTITIKKHQTLFDIALEQYGTCEAAGDILTLNPGLENDPAALAEAGIDRLRDTSLHLDIALAPGAQVLLDPQSPLVRRNTLKELATDITTYRYGPNNP